MKGEKKARTLKPKFPLLSLPREILEYVFSFLSFQDVVKIAPTCKCFNAATKNNLFWKDVARNNGIEPDFLENTQEPFSIKESILMQLKKLSIRGLYPKKMIDAMGGEAKFASHPVLDLRETIGYDSKKGYDCIDFVCPSDVKGAKIWRGVDKWDRPFVTICAKTFDPCNKETRIDVETLFRCFSNVDSFWVSGVGCDSREFVLNNEFVMQTSAYERLTRLVRGEKVGHIRSDGTEGLKETKEGRSVIRLTDQASDDESDDISSANGDRIDVARFRR